MTKPKGDDREGENDQRPKERKAAKESRREHEVRIWRQAQDQPDQEYHIIGWIKDDSMHGFTFSDGKPYRTPFSRQMHAFIDKMALTQQMYGCEPEELVKTYEGLLHAAELAERKHNLRELKKISDHARQLMAELPPDEEIPPGGHDDLDDMTFRARLSANEIRFRMISRLTQMGLEA